MFFFLWPHQMLARAVTKQNINGYFRHLNNTQNENFSSRPKLLNYDGHFLMLWETCFCGLNKWACGLCDTLFPRCEILRVFVSLKGKSCSQRLLLSARKRFVSFKRHAQIRSVLTAPECFIHYCIWKRMIADQTDPKQSVKDQSRWWQALRFYSQSSRLQSCPYKTPSLVLHVLHQVTVIIRWIRNVGVNAKL